MNFFDVTLFFIFYFSDSVSDPTICITWRQHCSMSQIVVL